MKNNELIYEILLDIKSLICIFFNLIKNLNAKLNIIFMLVYKNISNLDFDLLLDN